MERDKDMTSSDFSRAISILMHKFDSDELINNVKLLKEMLKQLDGRTVGLIAYNSWNTDTVNCWCRDNPYKCPCEPWKTTEKWMSLAHTFGIGQLHVVVSVEVSDIAFYGLAFENGDIIYQELCSDCDDLPNNAIKMLDGMLQIISEGLD